MNQFTDSFANSESLGQALLRSREHLLHVGAPSHVQTAVMAASATAMAQKRKALLTPRKAAMPTSWAQQIAAITQAPNMQVGAAFGAIFGAAMGAASMAFAAMLVWLLAPLGTAQVFNGQAANTNTAIAFTALPGAASDAASLRSPLQIVPLVLPHAQLSRYGLPFDPAHAAQPVRAEMLVNAQGQAVAVRFLP